MIIVRVIISLDSKHNFITARIASHHQHECLTLSYPIFLECCHLALAHMRGSFSHRQCLLFGKEKANNRVFAGISLSIYIRA